MHTIYYLLTTSFMKQSICSRLAFKSRDRVTSAIKVSIIMRVEAPRRYHVIKTKLSNVMCATNATTVQFKQRL